MEGAYCWLGTIMSNRDRRQAGIRTSVVYLPCGPTPAQPPIGSHTLSEPSRPTEVATSPTVSARRSHAAHKISTFGAVMVCTSHVPVWSCASKLGKIARPGGGKICVEPSREAHVLDVQLLSV